MKNIFSILLISVFVTGMAPKKEQKTLLNSATSKKEAQKNTRKPAAAGYELTKDELKQLKSKLKKNQSRLLSERENRRFARILKLMNKKQKESKLKAVSMLKKTTQLPAVKPSQKATAFWFLGIAYARMEDYKNSALYFEKALSLKSLGFDRHLNTLVMVSQLHLSQGDNKKARERLLLYLALADKPNPKAHVFMAQLEYQEKNKKKALKEILKAIEMKKKPDKNWLSFASNLYLQFEDYQSAEALLNRLTSLYPSAQKQWKMLSITKLNNNKTKSALAVHQLAHKVRPLEEESDIKQLSSLLAERGIPFKAAQSLKKAIDENKVKVNQKNYEWLGDLWTQAEEIELAVSAYEESSKKTTDNGNVFVKLGQIYLSQEKWLKAVKSIEKGLDTGNITLPDRAYFQIGLAYYNLKEYNQSLKAFQKAEELEGDYEIPSSQWIRQAKKYL